MYQSANFNKNLVYRVKLGLSQIGSEHQRKIYGFFDLIGDLGGVLELILVLFGIVVSPIANYSFIMKAADKLFYGRTSKEQVFDKE